MKDRIIKLYQNGSKQTKTDLEKEFGKDFFIQDVTERIKTFKDALREAATKRPEVTKEYEAILNLTGNYAKAIRAFVQLIVVTEALNEGWTPNWNDTTQQKWFPWFYVVGSSADYGADAGLGDVIVSLGAGDSYTAFGSRLCFSSKKLAKYAGNQFKDLYQDYYLG
jgi:hypothetical protein